MLCDQFMSRRARVVAELERMAAEWTLSCLPYEHLVFVEEPEMAHRDAATSRNFPDWSGSSDAGLERSIEEHIGSPVIESTRAHRHPVSLAIS
jgi:hypothetical protein